VTFNPPVFITYRDRFTMLERCVASLVRHGLTNITVIDNDSEEPIDDTRRVLPSGESVGVKVLRADNGARHLAPWAYGLVPANDYYIVMDCDVEIDSPAYAPEVQVSVADYLRHKLETNPNVVKLGLGIRVDDLLVPSPEHLIEDYLSETFVATCPVVSGLRMAPVDTHFAMHRPGTPNWPGICGARTMFPYLCRHLPWYNAEWSAEELTYYRRTPEWARTHNAESALSTKSTRSAP
jgi:hypothetical protein